MSWHYLMDRIDALPLGDFVLVCVLAFGVIGLLLELWRRGDRHWFSPAREMRRTDRIVAKEITRRHGVVTFERRLK